VDVGGWWYSACLAGERPWVQSPEQRDGKKKTLKHYTETEALKSNLIRLMKMSSRKNDNLRL
jgi:hypothetical protein